MIKVNNLSKFYGNHKAVDDISFEVNDGEIVGFLGPNGAGKTTTMNIITGYISYTDGEVKINDFDILSESKNAKKQLGYLPDVPPLYNDMTVMEYLNFVCDIKKVKKDERKEMLEKIIDISKIDNVKKRIIKNLSKGYKQRVGLAQALVGFPKVLILDEPMVGLDPKQIIEMRDVIKDLGKKHTILLSSHILSEVSAVCDRVIIISKGKIVASDSPENLSENLTSGHKIIVRIKGEKEDIEKAFFDREFIKSIDFECSREENTFDVIIQGSDDKDIREYVFGILSRKKLPILMMKPLDLTLEEIFLQVTDNKDENAKDYDYEDIEENNESELKEIKNYEINEENAKSEGEEK